MKNFVRVDRFLNKDFNNSTINGGILNVTTGIS
jgi:hypothetical protein